MMGVIGSLGEIIFEASARTVRTFDELTWDSTAKYAEHDRHLDDPLLEFTGNNLDEITFKMHFSTYLGIRPIDEITKLLIAKREGRAMRLVIGTKAYGKGNWVITKLRFPLNQFDNAGNLIVADATVSLKAYA